MKLKHIYLFCFVLFIHFTSYCQTSLIFNNGGYLVLADSVYLVIDNNTTTGITEIGASGNIVSEFERNIVKWNIEDQLGSYTVPFTNSWGVSIPVNLTITTPGSSTATVLFSTFPTDEGNLPFPNGIGNVSEPLNTVDRFWMVDPVNYSDFPNFVLSLTYDDLNEIGGINTITESSLLAERYNELSATWEGLFGVNNAGLNQVGLIAKDSTVQSKFWTLLSDTIPPVISNCPNDVVALSALGLCGDSVSWTEPIFTDNIGIDTIISTAISGDYFPVGTTIVQYIAIDFAGNSDTCEFTVTVTDNQAPYLIGCPAAISINTDVNACGAFVSWAPPITADNCGIDTLYSTYNSGDYFPIGSTLVQYIVVDNSGNTDTCTFTINVLDTIAPIIVGIPGTSLSSCEGEVIVWTAPTATDNCSIASFTSNYPSGFLFPTGSTTVIYTAVDASGNTTTAQFTVVVQNTPVIAISSDEITVCYNDPVVLAVVAPNSTYSYEWFYSTNSLSTGISYTIDSVTYSNSGDYEVIATDTTGCFASRVISVVVKGCGILVFEGVSPDGDGQNDVFYVDNLENYPNTRVQVFNRWGSEVFESDDYQNDWNCTSQSAYNVGGDQLPEGTYYYLIELGGDPAASDYGKLYKGFFYIKRK